MLGTGMAWIYRGDRNGNRCADNRFELLFEITEIRFKKANGESVRTQILILGKTCYINKLMRYFCVTVVLYMHIGTLHALIHIGSLHMLSTRILAAWY